MLIKICGLTRRADAEAAIAAGADLLGFVFRRGTPRAIDPRAAAWVGGLTGAARVGVFMDAPLDEVQGVRALLGLEWVQLHGAEPDAFLGVLGPQVIRRLQVAVPVDWDGVRRLAARCLPLFDPGAGAGVGWQWRVLAERPSGLRFGLAGGLTAATVAEAVRVVRPALVDVSSGVESAPGVKDHAKIRDFIAAARAAAASPPREECAGV
ncbi:MAG: phosphoribosylanthranilate isomerase [Thermoanaerobaculales bacterium]|nr:phosphoribosylanthranilate isomerase [Thermoanaerobaculales bacterium]